MTKITRKAKTLISKVAKTLGICYTVEVLTDMGNVFTHKCHTRKSVLEWLACYPVADLVMVSGFGGHYVIMVRGN